ncbi:hypothetical protein C8F04DRAFT_1401329 [Mycena alexandri]|uniref:Uncharacterized protein n=1 Tax=Mycena alexandri TaxID=1745969 RepID=A0AAD6WR78_9AGAR|nr:hypothetical protein C8F04DRAFT_1401329 [Mycena alexandri]
MTRKIDIENRSDQRPSRRRNAISSASVAPPREEDCVLLPAPSSRSFSAKVVVGLDIHRRRRLCDARVRLSKPELWPQSASLLLFPLSLITTSTIRIDTRHPIIGIGIGNPSLAYGRLIPISFPSTSPVACWSTPSLCSRLLAGQRLRHRDPRGSTTPHTLIHAARSTMGGCISSPAPPGAEVSERDRALHRQAEKQLKEAKAKMQAQVKVPTTRGRQAAECEHLDAAGLRTVRLPCAAAVEGCFHFHYLTRSVSVCAHTVLAASVQMANGGCLRGARPLKRCAALAPSWVALALALLLQR